MSNSPRVSRIGLSTRSIAFASVSTIAMAFGTSGAWAQTTTTTTAANAGAIKEITVTAERRTQSLQKVAASVVAIKAADITAQGKISTAQILEDVPNVTFQAPTGGDNPNGNITIRGVQSTQTTGGTAGPSATATYVDDVFEGIGSDLDLSQVEVLRGPQGTLYGRSATGGVVSFHTNDPVLGKYAGTASFEYGSYDLRQAMVAANLPIDDQIALRVAGKEFDQHGYLNSEGGSNRDQEVRIKALYQPLSNLRILGSWTMDEQHVASGGVAPTLSSPNTIDYSGVYDPIGSAENRAHQLALTAKYDAGFATITYIGALRNWVQNATVGPETGHGQTLTNTNFNPLDQYHTEELRIQSEPGSKLTWLLGGNFYSNLFKTGQLSIQDAADDPGSSTPDTTPGIDGAEIFKNGVNGETTDVGVFTEETYPVTDKFRLTGGARFDSTRVKKFTDYYLNFDLDPAGNSLLPNNLVYYGYQSTETFTNFTFKARAEYDLTPSNTVYGMVSTGFLPGDQQLSPQIPFGPIPLPGGGTTFGPQSVNFVVLPFTQERLTSYEIGSKNRFLDNTLQFNADAFYYKYSGYQEAANTALHGPPIFTTIAVPLTMKGAEIDAIWRVTPDDRITLSGSVLDAQVSSYPTVPGLNPLQTYLELARLPGIPPVQATITYDHTFVFADGSSLVPRAQARFIGAENLANLTQAESENIYTYDPVTHAVTGQTGWNERGYVHQDATVVADIGATWTSANGKYLVTGYIRNVTNNIFKNTVTPESTGTSDINTTPDNPRTYGMVLSAKF